MNRKESTKSSSVQFGLPAKGQNTNSTASLDVPLLASGTANYFTPTQVASNVAGSVRITPATGELRITPLEPLFRPARMSDKVIAKAVLNHLRFQRTRGVVKIDVEDVARALSLSVAQVKKAVSGLTSKGVRLEG